MSESKSLVARIWNRPSWFVLLLSIFMLGWLHWKDVKNERVKQQFIIRIAAIEIQNKRTDLLLSDYNTDEKVLRKQLAEAEARSSATDGQIEAFRVNKTRLDKKLVLVQEQIKRTRVMLDKLQKDKNTGIFDKQ